MTDPRRPDLWPRLRAIRLAMLALEAHAVARPFDVALSRVLDLLTLEYEATLLVLTDRPRRRRRREGARMPLASLPEIFLDQYGTETLSFEEVMFCFWENLRRQLGDAKCAPQVVSLAHELASELGAHRAQALRERLRDAAA